ncbi:Rho GTPase-activating protein 15 [Tritrichomonas musculus]|uniref:Rho GTPase-activating protein 15 n=1 Tax=Tritrichomonas musculus TaxID=1915356 RepID=A0ABR2L1Y4_9EUKA
MTLIDPRPGPHFFTKKLNLFYGKVPFIITDIINEMEKLNSSQVEGIFRLSAQKTTVENLCLQLDTGRVFNYQGYEEPHIMACVIKRYIRELSLIDPLISSDIAEDINTEVQTHTGDPQIYTNIQKLIDKNPCKTKRNTLAVLMKFFNRITKDASVNRMEASNFAIVFAPSLYPRSDSVASGSAMKAIELMITDHDKIFKPEWSDPKIVYLSNSEVLKMSEPFINEQNVVIESQRRFARLNSCIPIDRSNLMNILHIKRPDRPAPLLT